MHPAPIVTTLNFVHVNIAGTGTNVMTEDGDTGAPLTGARLNHNDGRITVIITAGAGNIRNGGPTGDTYVIISDHGNVYDAKLKARLGNRYLFKK